MPDADCERAMPHRRTFLKTLAGTALATAASSRRVAGANNRVRVGFIGIGLIGRRHLLDFQAQADCEIAGICEVSDERRDDGVSTAGNAPAAFDDFRRMLDRADIDAVVVSTPDHWHALMTIMACAAGKDVYVEKPLTHVLREGEWMIEAARRHRRVVQVGTQQRAGVHYQRARRLLQDGHIGEIRGARVSTARNILPGFTAPVGKPLSQAQWDMWLGPAPVAPYEPTRGLYHFRWFWDYSGGQTTNLLAHEVDIVQWVTGQVPRRVAAFAQRRSLTGIGETPDVFEGIFDYPGFLLNWSSREVAAGGRDGLELYGTRGTLAINRRGFEILPDPQLTPESQIPRFTGTGGGSDDAFAAVRGRQGRGLRPGARPVPAARQEFPGLREVTAAAAGRSRERAPDVDRLPSRQHRHAHGPRHSVGPAAQRHRGRSGRLGAADQVVPRALGPAPARRDGVGMTSAPTRREFLSVMAVGAGLATGRQTSTSRTRMCLAYTSFAVRMLQGRDILKSTAAALPAEGLLDLTERFWAGGAQVDLSQLESHDPAYLARVRAKSEKAGLWLELSVPSKYLESPDAYAQMAGVAQALGVDRIRVALLYGRRYESFATLDAWAAHDRKWRNQLAAITPVVERFPIRVGLENHKDYTARRAGRAVDLAGQREDRRMRRLRQQRLAARGSARHHPHARAVCRDHTPEGHGGAAVTGWLRAVGSAAR